jgi:hypothetical protein
MAQKESGSENLDRMYDRGLKLLPRFDDLFPSGLVDHLYQVDLETAPMHQGHKLWQQFLLEEEEPFYRLLEDLRVLFYEAFEMLEGTSVLHEALWWARVNRVPVGEAAAFIRGNGGMHACAKAYNEAVAAIKTGPN